MSQKFIHSKMSRLLICGCIFLHSMGGMIGNANAQNQPEPIKTNDKNGAELYAKVQPYYKYRKDGKAGREVILMAPGMIWKGDIRIVVQCDGKAEESKFSLTDGQKVLPVLLPDGVGVKKSATAQITLYSGQQELKASVIIPESKQWKVYIYPHSHVDIGYTALQDTVKKLHIRNIDVGIDLAEKTQNYPEGARFIWNPEATWVVEAYWKQATPEKKRRFINAVKKGWLQIDGGHSNINTSTFSDEQLEMMFSNKNRIEQQTKVPIHTMVQMDLPGVTWGLVEAAKQNGIDGFISFPNYFDLRKEWEHKPFYWLGADGKSRILFLQGSPYGYGYTVKGSKYGLKILQSYSDTIDRVKTNNPSANFIDPFIFSETDRLQKEGSPYDIFAMTWSMADNCLIDADLPEAVKLWNEKYAYPKVIIAGSRDILAAYEKQYGSIIPQYSGDITEFWTNGLGSDALRVGMGRRAKENLVQAETLWPMVNGDSRPAPVAKFNDCWEQLLLSAEHTWGYQNPKAPLAKQVEANKAAFFEHAEQQSNELIKDALQNVQKENGGSVSVFNTLSWARNGLVTLNAKMSSAGNRVIDENGKEVPSQRLSTGELLFSAENIPAFGSRSYKVVPGNYKKGQDLKANAAFLSNSKISVKLNKATGNITSLFRFQDEKEFVDPASGFDLNSYNYVKGVFNGKDTVSAATHASNVKIEVKENGPLLVSVNIHSDAEGCNWLNREIKLYKDQLSIEIVNTIDKISTRRKEGIHFGFGFNIPSGVTRMDIPMGVMEPERDQLKGTNKNWLAFQRWVDISNKNDGITWTSIESPLVELGSMTGNILDGARQGPVWVKKIPQNQTIISWMLNNHWDTNFPLAQGGKIASSYGILLHGAYDPVVANRFGVEQQRPLIAVETQGKTAVRDLVTIDNPRIMLSSYQKNESDKRVQLRLRSVSDQTEKVKLKWKDGTSKTIDIQPYSTATVNK